MSTEYNNTSDWTLEDCQSYINILYANRTSSFKERKAKAFFNSQTKKNRKTTITNDGIYVDGKPFLSPANIKKCVSVGSLYFFERKDSMLIRCVKADGEKLQIMKDFLSVNNIDFTSRPTKDLLKSYSQLFRRFAPSASGYNSLKQTYSMTYYRHNSRYIHIIHIYKLIFSLLISPQYATIHLCLLYQFKALHFKPREVSI